MSKSIAATLALSLFVTLGSLIWSEEASAQAVGQTKEIAPGVVRKNLGEYPANVSGFEKVRVVEDTVRPGAKVGPVEMPVPMFCTVLKGQATLVLDGNEMKLKAGDSYVCALGQKAELKNTGSEPYVERMHHLLKAGQ